MPVLTRNRIWFAFSVAVLTDAVQLVLGPLGWVVVDQSLDVIAMALTTVALGFHMLLLPTFVIELVPVADMLPTWTGCVAAVVVLRRRAQTPPPLSLPDSAGPGTADRNPFLPSSREEVEAGGPIAPRDLRR